MTSISEEPMRENRYHHREITHSPKYTPPATKTFEHIERLSLQLQWWELMPNSRGRSRKVRQSVAFDLSPNSIENGSCTGDLVTVLAVHGLLPGTAISFGDFVRRVFMPAAFEPLQPGTRDRYWRTLRVHLLPPLEKEPIARINTWRLQHMLDEKQRAGLGWEALGHIKALLMKVFACSKAWGYTVAENPAQRLLLPKRTPVRTKRVLTLAQIHSLGPVLREPARLMAALALGTGMRIGEILALRWKDCDFDSQAINIQRCAYRGYIGVPECYQSRRVAPRPSHSCSITPVWDKCKPSDGNPHEGLDFYREDPSGLAE
jgi:hypothetical protein